MKYESASAEDREEDLDKLKRSGLKKDRRFLAWELFNILDDMIFGSNIGQNLNRPSAKWLIENGY